MSDIFIEQMIKKQRELKDVVRNVAIMTVGFVLAAGLLFLLLMSFPYKEYVGAFIFLLFVGVIYYTWYIIAGLNLEYEYIFTNGEMDVDKISNKRRRKRMACKPYKNYRHA